MLNYSKNESSVNAKLLTDRVQSEFHAVCSEVKSHLGSHLPTPVTRLYTQHTSRQPEVASSNTMGEGDGCKGKLDLEIRES
jgi:hypothetical protein